ncbi:hypothetical protein M3196_00005 [Fictibacillus nanhaiensis]|uniref:hypothetical protein n=1 Tax=Fictibacillus nanhaiensis TaxID=742169 RepID=UPI00203A9786|nr:hypothetical protein [Fictibacillus nanhaiensis]MCM3730051.1 hypothetical protein [Fictibacillus nanhaiensis]
MLSIGMTNSNYSECSENVKNLSKHTKMDEKVIYDFFNTSNSNFKSTIESALKNLMDKRVIMFDTVIKVREKDTYTPRTASQIERAIIMDCETKIFEELGYTKISSVRVSKDWKKFKSKVKKYLNEYSDIEYYYTAYDITINEKYIEQERNILADLLIEEFKRNQYKNELNSTVYENLITNAKKRRTKELEFWGDTKRKMSSVRKSDTYIEDIKRLANLLISIDTPSFLHELRNIDIPTITHQKELLDSWCEEMLG